MFGFESVEVGAVDFWNDACVEYFALEAAAQD
jgi:hypothetical protein